MGSLKREDIGKAMRSVYPEFVVSKRHANSVALIEEDSISPELSFEADEVDPELSELEQFLAEHQVGETPDEAFEEPDVAEALAVSWRERRKEMTKLQRARKFTQAGDMKRSFKVEIEEMKRRTKCNKCGQIGHWARECRSAKGSGKGHKNSSAPSSASQYRTPENGVAMVEEFIATVSIVTPPSSSWLSLQWLLNKRANAVTAPSEPVASSTEMLLVSSPGCGVLDSGCGKSIIGADTLKEFEALWTGRGWELPVPFTETNHFKYGNGHQETSELAVRVPVRLGGRAGTIKVAIVKGQAPLLVSRNALKSLKAVINFADNELQLFDDQVKIPLLTNQAGQYTVDLLGQPDDSALQPFAEVMITQPSSTQECDTPNPAQPSNDPELSSSSTSAAGTDEFAPHAESLGFSTRSYDLKTGFDFRKAITRQQVKEELRLSPPELLILCPPCTNEGQYTPQFVQAVLQTVPTFQQYEATSLVECEVGIKDMIMGGTFRSKNFIDLVPGHYPTLQPDDQGEQRAETTASDAPAAQEIPQIAPTGEQSTPSPNVDHDVPMTAEASNAEPDTAMPEVIDKSPMPSQASYGLIRSKHRVHEKSGEAALYRPPMTRHEDFVEIMREIVPQLIDQQVTTSSGSSSASGIKRDYPETTDSTEPPTTRARLASDDQLSIEVLSVQDCNQLCQLWDKSKDVEVLIAAYLQKRAGKEIPSTGNPPLLQQAVDESKLVEWTTLMEKGAIRVHTGKKAAWIKTHHPDRFMGSRFVIVRKPLEENLHFDPEDPNTFRVKSRWCLQGHLDPDLDTKLHEGNQAAYPITPIRADVMAWSQKDNEQLRALLHKASRNGVNPLTDLGWVEDDFELIGTMSDASKRQSDQGQYPMNTKSGRKTMQVPEQEYDVKGPSTYAAKSDETPFPSTTPELMSDVPLPPGIVSTKQWGNTKISFGKYKSRNWCYRDLIESEEDEARSYVKWCRPRLGSSCGELKDLIAYIHRFEAESSRPGEKMGCLIPGTEVRRSFK
ncbi:unnamed protein product [Durusdinium trenchii]|uniref:CCHC-type domain-containing protein n=1 Tax=Durusdinium trenchii TaxID=1381693 RepID=A0ABP0J0C8_9DINO